MVGENKDCGRWYLMEVVLQWLRAGMSVWEEIRDEFMRWPVRCLPEDKERDWEEGISRLQETLANNPRADRNAILRALIDTDGVPVPVQQFAQETLNRKLCPGCGLPVLLCKQSWYFS